MEMNKNVVVFDIGISNITSVINAFDVLGIKNSLISSWDEDENIPNADFYILPGVGSFDEGVDRLQKSGIGDLLKIIYKKGKSIIGICLGMQLLLSTSEESKSNKKGLSFINGNVKKLNENITKVPHIGWDTVYSTNYCPINLKKLINHDFYFIHSFFCNVDQKFIVGEVNLGRNNSITVALKKENLYGFQFHPEKSQEAGLELFRNLILS